MAIDELYQQAVLELEGRGVMPDRPPGLESTREGLARIGFEHSPLAQLLRKDPTRVIVVAGTNGKGSVCATLEALLMAEGERTGLYTSPHLVDTTERFRIAGEDVSREIFVQAWQEVSRRTQGLKLSHFEMLTLMAIWIFGSGEALPPVDRLILEVGLGGTWDSTNAVPHGVCVVTSLGMDHEKILGPTLADIARNKFGIVPENASVPPIVAHAPLPAEASAVAEHTRARTGGRWTECVPHTLEVDASSGRPRFELVTRWGRFEIALPGARGALNTALALTVFEALGHSPERHAGRALKVRWPGRMDLLDVPGFPCPVYLSGDHNPQGVASLLELLPHYPRRHLHVLAGVGFEKDLEGVLAPLSRIPQSSLYLTETPFRGRKLSEYGSWLERVEGAWADPAQALREVSARASSGHLILVTGSLYLVGDIRGRFVTAAAKRA